MKYKKHPPLYWLPDGECNFPDVRHAWGADSPAPGLLAAGGSLDVQCLRQAYAQGIFPWFGDGEPVFWWSTDPRMVLQVQNFCLRRSLRKTLQRFTASPHCEIRMDSAFSQVIDACARSPRAGQGGTWIVPAMQAAYIAFHHAGYAHSVETWINGELAGGLYCVNIGKALFGESMFTHVTDASKIALAALVAFCRSNGIALIDCQQNTRHLASLGAHEIARADFLQHIRQAQQHSAPQWRFDPLYWKTILPPQGVSEPVAGKKHL